MIASLAHPGRNASNLRFFANGTRLLTADYFSYPQIWDLTSKQKVLRIDLPKESGAILNAHVPAHGKTLYVKVGKESQKSVEREGKKATRLEYAGEIRVWDVQSGKEKEPLRPSAGHGPTRVWLSPNNRYLACIEASFDEFEIPFQQAWTEKGQTVIWDLSTGKKWKLTDNLMQIAFFPDSETAAGLVRDGKTETLTRLQVTTGKESARRTIRTDDRIVLLGPVSPDGSIITVRCYSNKGAPAEFRFFDARTLEERGKLVGKERSGNGRFTPDSKRYIASDFKNVFFWDVAAGKLERTLTLDRKADLFVIRPDGRLLATAWVPQEDAGADAHLNPGYAPQPHISLIDLQAPEKPPRILVAPRGMVKGLAFSPDGKFLALGSTGATHLFDLEK